MSNPLTLPEEHEDHRPDPPRPLRVAGRARAPQFTRNDVYPRPVVDGREQRDNPWTRLRAWMKSATTSRGEREEAELEQQLRSGRRVTRTNTIAVISPKGGVGKTTCTFLLGNLLASHLKLRVLAIDANRDFGTLAELAPASGRVQKSAADLLAHLAKVDSAPALAPYVSALPSGLHLLAAPEHAEVMAEMDARHYGQLLAFLSRYYDAILLDLGTGIVDPLAQFALGRADQALVVTTPEFVTSSKVLGALRYLNTEAERPDHDGPDERLTVVLNRAPGSRSGDRQVIEAAFRRLGANRHVVIPHDERLRVMLDSATYTLESLERPSRIPLKQLGLTVAQRLV